LRNAVIIGMGIAAIITLLSVFAVSKSTTTISAPNNNNNKQQNTNNYRPITFFAIEQCTAEPHTAYIVNARGFAMVVPRGTSHALDANNSTGSSPMHGPYEFVLKPEHAAYLTLFQDFCPLGINNTRPSYSPVNYYSSVNYSAALVASDFKAIAEDNPRTLNETITNLTKINDHALQVTYAISAPQDNGTGTYMVGLYGMCPGELLTIGDKPANNTTIKKFLDTPYYGCS
jgi:hypothetical protein